MNGRRKLLPRYMFCCRVRSSLHARSIALNIKLLEQPSYLTTTSGTSTLKMATALSPAYSTSRYRDATAWLSARSCETAMCSGWAAASRCNLNAPLSGLLMAVMSRGRL